MAALALVASATGCATAPRGSLAKTPPADIKVGFIKSGAKGLCPGFGDQLFVRVIDREGKSHYTREHVQGTLHWANFDIRMRGGTVGPTGKLRLIPNAERLLFKPPALEITPMHWPKRAKTVRLPMRFDCAFKAHFAGRRGRRGKPGLKGRAVKGTLSVLKHAGKQYLRVVLKTVDDGFALGGSFLLTPGRGSLTIDVSGGQGGRPDPNGKFPGGPGGDAGSVELTVDPMAKGFMSMVTVRADGGKPGTPDARPGRKGPAPKLVHKPVFEPL